MNKLKLSIGSDYSENINKVEHFIEDVIDTFKVSEKLQGSILMAIIEATNNAIIFGNKKDSQKLVRYTAIKRKQKITVTVEDEGEGFDFRNVPNPGAYKTSQSLTGRGIYIMSKLSDELLFTKNGSKVTMTFYTEE